LFIFPSFYSIRNPLDMMIIQSNLAIYVNRIEAFYGKFL
jgi:hypothetical protein